MSYNLDIPVDANHPVIQAALTELRGLIATRYPAATFVVYRGEDPEGSYLSPMVDVDDLDEVLDVVLNRMVEIQETGLPVYVVPDWPPERVRTQLLQSNQGSRDALVPAR